MNPEKKADTKTSKEKREERIRQLKAQIHKEEARLKSENRKERNGQLIAFGIFLEAFLQDSDENGWKAIKERMQEYLSGRNLERCLAGMKRISQEMASRKKEISPEPPSQLPEDVAKEKIKAARSAPA